MQKVELQAWSKVSIGFVESDPFNTNAKGRIVPKTVPMLQAKSSKLCSQAKSAAQLAMDEHPSLRPNGPPKTSWIVSALIGY